MGASAQRTEENEIANHLAKTGSEHSLARLIQYV
jgi:hypothetical protein